MAKGNRYGSDYYRASVLRKEVLKQHKKVKPKPLKKLTKRQRWDRELDC